MSLIENSGLTNGQTKQQEGIRSGFVVGVDIGGTNLRLTLADQSGAIKSRWSTSTVGIRDPQEIVRLTCRGIDILLADAALSRDRLIGVGVGAPGITNSDEGIVIATSYLMGWQDVPLRALLEDALSVPVFIDNDVNMAVFGEFSAGSARGVRDFVFLAVGTGVGAGIVIDGQVFRGEGWLAGEIGYMLVPGASVDPVDEESPGALEEIVGGEGVRKRWQSLCSEGSTTLGRDATATQIFDEAEKGDLLAQSVMELSARTLAYAIYNLSLVLNCPRFVMGGSVGLHPALIRATEAVLRRLNPRVQPDLVPSILGSEAQIIGAVYRAIEVASTRPIKAQ
jgi:glucokinase